MKVAFIGADYRSGISEKSGKPKPYSMARVYYAIPAKDKTTENYVYQAHGFRVLEIDLDPKALPLFEGLALGEEVDLEVQPLPQNPSRNIVTGIFS